MGRRPLPPERRALLSARSAHALRPVARLVALLALLAAAPVRAERLPQEQVPEALRPWIGWALRGHEELLCPIRGSRTDTTICIWPGRLVLDLGASGGSFAQDVRLERAGLVPLPGDAERWPEQVTADGRPAAVVASGDRPALQLGAGVHALRGRFVWSALPALLAVPPETGLVALKLGGEEAPFPSRDESGRLWLRPGAADAGESARSLQLDVHRRVVDDVPLVLRTRVALRASGPAREETIGPALPAGFVPFALTSDLPARIEPDGMLRLQVRAGAYELEIDARHEGPVQELALAAPPEGALWAPNEIWVFEARPALRVVTVEGVSVDPAQTTLPDDWRGLPAYRMEPGTKLTLVERRRGDADPAPDELTLRRTWYVDFDGGGATVSDRMTGTVHARTRLEMGERTVLGRAAVNGSDQFITHLAASARPGVQLSPGAVSVEADSRVEGSLRALPAVGWDRDVAALTASVELPPGYELLHASGVDRASWTWWNRWTLLDLFLALVVAVAFARLYGAGMGVLAALALALTATEPGAPRWVWLAALAATALQRVVPPGRLRTATLAARALALAALVVLAVPFVVQALRVGLHPALGARSTGEPLETFDLAAQPGAVPPARAPETAADAALEEAPRARVLEKRSELKSESGEGYSAPIGSTAPARGRPAQAFDPLARITTGPGVPSWSWRRAELTWSGPVERNQELSLWLIPPWLNSILSFLRAALVLALAACLFGVHLPRPAAPQIFGSAPAGAAGGGGGAASGAALVLLAALSFGVRARAADFPSPELLEELSARLTEAPACGAECASVSLLRIDAQGARLSLALDVAAAVDMALPLPGGASSWLPSEVSLDGAATQALRRDEGQLWLRVPAGAHRIALSGPLPRAAAVALPLPLLPRRGEAHLAGWQLQGLHADGTLERTLSLAREIPAAEEAPAPPAAALPPFVAVERRFALGLHWTVSTRARRLSPDDTALVLDLPLLPGESVSSAGVEVRDGRARLAFAPGVRQVAIASTLETQGVLVLSAPEGVPWSETWRVDALPIWHLASQGIAPIQADARGAGGGDVAWRPWPGERVRIDVERPEGVGGATLTIDSSALALRPGVRSTDAELGLALRSSQGGEHRVTLPEGAQLQRVLIGGVEQPLRQEGRAVVLPLQPGAQAAQLSWREGAGMGALWRAAPVDLGAPSVNARVSLEPPMGRWILWVAGPPLGPAVLFWPVLVAYVAIGVALGRLRPAPLRAWEWALLAVGLTQAGVVGAGVVALWVLALGARAEYGARLSPGWFDLAQLALVALTLAAAAALFAAIRAGLLGLPDMQIAGNDSSAALLQWYQDRSGAELPRPRVLSLPLFVYRLAMLAWALWIAASLVRWVRFGWRAFANGGLWRRVRVPRAAAAATAPPRGEET